MNWIEIEMIKIENEMMIWIEDGYERRRVMPQDESACWIEWIENGYERRRVTPQDEPACCIKDVRRRVNINDESASVVIMVKKC